MKLSVVIPTTAQDQLCWNSINSCLSQKTDFPFEVIGVSNFPNKDLQNKAKLINNFHYFCSQSPGANRARNLGLKNARGEILFFLDDDCQLESQNYLANLVWLHTKHLEICVIGGGYSSPTANNCWGRMYNDMVNLWAHSHSFGQDIHLVPGGNCSFKAKLLGENKFDSNIIYGGTETELLLRLQKKGLQVLYLQELKVQHKVQISLAVILKKAWKQGLGKSLYKSPNGKVPIKNLKWTFLIFLMIYYSIVQIAFWNKKIFQKH